MIWPNQVFGLTSQVFYHKLFAIYLVRFSLCKTWLKKIVNITSASKKVEK
uniref:Uncharacterized protein n=1 Tax=Anguilla anguilla TaxID=7936 RepID=A0A0E9QLQ8_ANGAN